MNNLLKFFIFLCWGQSLFCSQIPDFDQIRKDRIDQRRRDRIAILIDNNVINHRNFSYEMEMKPSVAKLIITYATKTLEEINSVLEIKEANKKTLLEKIERNTREINIYKKLFQKIDYGQSFNRIRCEDAYYRLNINESEKKEIDEAISNLLKIRNKILSLRHCTVEVFKQMKKRQDQELEQMASEDLAMHDIIQYEEEEQKEIQRQVDRARNEALKLQQKQAAIEKIRLEKQAREEKSKADRARNEALKLQKKQDDALKKEEEKRKAQLQAASLKNKNKKIAKVIRVDEDLEFLKEMQAQAQKERDELFELQRKNELEHKRIQEEQVIAAKKEKAEIEERISTMTYQSFVEGRQQDRVDDPYTNLKPLFEGYVDIVCGPSTKSTLTSIRQLNLEIVRRHKKLCLRNERISWYFALDEDLRKRASDRFKELEEEVKDKASEKFNHELSTLKDKSMQMKSILKDLEKLLKEAIAAKNKPLMGIYSNAIKSKKIDYENTLRELKQYEVLVAKILHFDQMDALLGGGGLLNTDRLFDETINIADWNRGFLSQEFFENQFSFIDSCIDTVKKIFPTTEFSPYDNLQSQLTSIDLHVLPVIQIILNEIGVSEEKRLNLTEWIINIAHNHAENYALDRFDLDNFNHHTFYYLKNINKDDEIRYSPEQLNDLRKIQIMLIKSYSKIFKKDE